MLVRVTAAVSAVLLVLGVSGAAQATVTEARITNDNSVLSYSRYDGVVDLTSAQCNVAYLPQNEPTIAVDPHDTNVVVAGANDTCPGKVPPNIGWVGYYRSLDGGATWQDSLVPGYPADTSPAGLVSPTHGSCSNAADPTQFFDKDGRLFYGFICYNTAKPTSASIYVATYDQDGSHYLRTVQVEAGTPSGQFASGLFQDHENLAVDQTGGPRSGNVYIAWERYSGKTLNNVVLFSSSTDHGASFSKPIKLNPGQPGFANNVDLAVGPDGAVYATYRTYDTKGPRVDSIWLVKSTDGGKTFGSPSLVAPITPFDSTQFNGGLGSDVTDCSASGCPSGLTFSRFESISAVAADARGVHVVWSARQASGQAKIFVRTSPDGVNWSSPAAPLDAVAVGHQYNPDIASAGGVITAVFYDSRADLAYSPSLPPGNTADGKNSGGAVDTYVATSTDGGVTWTERRVSSVSSNFDLRSFFNFPFWGDYIYVSAVPGAVNVAWTDSRDVVSCSGASCNADGFDASWNENIYGARVSPVP